MKQGGGARGDAHGDVAGSTASSIGGSGDAARGAADHAYRVLELPRVLAAVGSRATSALGRAHVLALRPATELDGALRALDQVEAVRALLAEGEFPGVPVIPPAAEDLGHLRVDGSVLSGSALVRLQTLLASAGALRHALKDGSDSLHVLRDALLSEPRLTKALDRTLEADGTVRDGASPELGRVRKEIRRVQSNLVRALESAMAALPERIRVEDASVTVRNGRFVIPVRREGRSAVGGVVHDQSATGATLFVEPPGQIERMNKLRELELAERREVHRVLAERTGELRPHVDALKGSLHALVAFDSLYARARTADAWSATRPGLVSAETGALCIVDGRHPLLLEKAGAVVPFSLSLEPDERVIVVSGPNTGGKSVLLKAIGLVPALAMCGVVPPVGPGSVVPLYTGFFADIGDEQSIQEDLSTFSAHVASLRTILAGAGPGSIVLLDELGTGTDPAEGAALAQAVLEHLRDAGALTVATSHLGALKRLDTPGSGILNASLQFDADRMEPTYRFVKGRPGRSFGLAIGRRLALPQPVTDRAADLLAGDVQRQDDLLERLEAEERRARELTEQLERDRRKMDALRSDLERRERDVEDREKEATRAAHAEARRIVMDARSEVERAIADARSAAGDASAEREARRRVEEEARRHKASAERTRPTEPQDGPDLAPGTRVRVAGGASGTLVETADGAATVELDGGVRMKVPLATLQVDRSEKARKKGSVHWTASTDGATTEVDLRGLRVDEVEAPLFAALDRAVLADLPSLRIIHGKGTGAVKARVRELIAEDPRVLSHASGGEGEGGTGVTVVMLR